MAQPDCPHCQGSGWKVVERTEKGAQPLATDRPGAPSQGEPKMVWAVPCECTTGDRTERALQRARATLDTAEVADAVLFLCGEGAGAITGQAIAVAGGEV